MENMKSYTAAAFWVLFFVIFAAVPLVKTSDYQLMLASHILVWGMFAVAFNLLFGLTGMLSFGQGLYYGLGAYSVGMMVRYLGESWFVPGIVIGLLGSIVLSILIGLLIIRVSGVFFTVLTLAFGQLIWQIVFNCYQITGGDDGIQGLIPPGILSDRVVYYYFALILVLMSIWCYAASGRFPMGLVLRCIRQNPERVRFLGGRVKRNQLRIYIISSFFSALAGSSHRRGRQLDPPGHALLDYFR